MRRIDADALKAEWYKINDIGPEDCGARFVGYQEIARLIDNAPTVEPGGDLISRADAIEAVMAECRKVYTSEYASAVRIIYEDDAVEALSALPSADAEPTVIRSKTLLPTKDFKEWAKRVRETNPNVIVIPCDAEVVSADAVQGEWVDIDNYYRMATCSHCHKVTMFEKWGEYTKPYDYCPNCGARMKGGDDE